MRLGLPSPFEELPHTADVGIRARGADLPEVLSRAVLAMAQLQAGGGAVGAAGEEVLQARGEDRASLLVDLARQVLQRFFLSRRLLAAIEITWVSETALSARCWFGPFDPAAHGEGMDVKAVTYARAAVEPGPEGLVATLLFDV